MKALLEGGRADGRECDVDARTKKISVPIQIRGKRGFGQLIYSRTDRRQDGAVIFTCANARS